jgi:hypothetical protein
MVMVACEITAPLLSVIVPLNVPASSCPRISGQKTSKIVINSRRHEYPLRGLALFAETFGTNAAPVHNFDMLDLIRQVMGFIFGMSLSLKMLLFVALPFLYQGYS